MMVFFLSNMIENQCMSTGAFEITLNGELGTACLGECAAGVGELLHWAGGMASAVFQSGMVCDNCPLPVLKLQL